MKQPKEIFGALCYLHDCYRALTHKAECCLADGKEQFFFFSIRHMKFKKPATFSYWTDISFSKHLLLRICSYRSMHCLRRYVCSEYVLTVDTAKQ